MSWTRLIGLVLALPGTMLGQVPLPSSLPAPAPLSAAEGGKDYTQISLEELLNKDITVAATKTRIDVAKAPVSVVVVTPDDIRRSGAATLGEVFRTVPGLDVLESFPGYISVSARGTSEAFPNNMLVLIDGRRLETQLAGVAFLEEAPLRLEDIKRIEVIKGPVGALYGTNALAGVISITTFSPLDVRGTLVSVVAGNRDTYQVTLRQAGPLGAGPWAYKLTGGYSYASTWESLRDVRLTPPAALRKGDLVGLLQGRFADESQLDIEAGLSVGDLASLTVVTNQTQYFKYPHLRLAYGRPRFHAQLTYNPQSLELRERVPPIQPLFDQWSHAVNLAVDRSLTPFSGSTLTLGGNLRYQRSEFTTLLSPKGQVVGSLFVQNQQDLVADRLALFGAVGVSHHPELDAQLDANVALVATPVKNHSFRVSFGRGHRDPSFNENYNGFIRQIGPATAYLAGRTDLEPESNKSWEAGYHGQFALTGSARLVVFAEGFKQKLRNLIGSVTTPVRLGSLPQAPRATLLQEFRNLDARDGKGFEVGAELDLPAFKLMAHHSYQDYESAATGRRIQADIPRNKFSAGLRTQRGPLEFDVWVHSVSHSLAAAANLPDQGYVLVNPRVALKLDRWTLSVQAFNALNERHVETANARNVRGETLGRLVTFGLRYQP